MAPTGCSAVMSVSVHGVLQWFVPHYSVATAVRDLTTGVVLGVLIYCLMLWGLWRLSRRPDTAEVACAIRPIGVPLLHESVDIFCSDDGPRRPDFSMARPNAPAFAQPHPGLRRPSGRTATN